MFPGAIMSFFSLAAWCMIIVGDIMSYPLIIQIGSVDLTDVALCGKVTIDTSAVYAAQTFTNMLGETKKTYLGDRVHIKASFEDLPKTKALAIQGACASETVTISFLNPGVTSASFERPTVSMTISRGDAENEYWDISIDAVCPLMGDGL